MIWTARERRKMSRSGSKTASRRVRGAGAATAGSGDQTTIAMSGRKRNARPQNTRLHPILSPTVIATAPAMRVAARYSATRAPTASPCSCRSSTSTAYPSIAMSCEADQNAMKTASVATRATLGSAAWEASSAIPAKRKIWETIIQERLRPSTGNR